MAKNEEEKPKIIIDDDWKVQAQAEALNINLKGMTLKNPAVCPNIESMAQTLFKERARKGDAFFVGYDKTLIFDEPRRLNLYVELAYYTGEFGAYGVVSENNPASPRLP